MRELAAHRPARSMARLSRAWAQACVGWVPREQRAQAARGLHARARVGRVHARSLRGPRARARSASRTGGLGGARSVSECSRRSWSCRVFLDRVLARACSELWAMGAVVEGGAFNEKPADVCVCVYIWGGPLHTALS